MITQALLKEVLKYNPKTGIFMWIKQRGRASIGDIAGCNKLGYIEIRVYGKKYKAHNLAFLYMTGKFPAGECDHINHIKNDNTWSNLRDVTHQNNKRNVKLLKTNSSGIVGVKFHKRDKKWMVYIGHDGKQLHLGNFDNIFDAAACRIKASRKYGYHENHGR